MMVNIDMVRILAIVSIIISIFITISIFIIIFNIFQINYEKIIVQSLNMCSYSWLSQDF